MITLTEQQSQLILARQQALEAALRARDEALALCGMVPGGECLTPDAEHRTCRILTPEEVQARHAQSPAAPVNRHARRAARKA